MRIALGPVLYLWEREQIFDFYSDVAETPVDIVYLGETVCAKRRKLRFDDWLELGRMLTGRGKQVVLSTLALVEAESEVGQVARVCNNGEFLVEANDAGALDALQEKGLQFVAGPGMNIYSARTLAWLSRAGLVRWVPPVEMSGKQVADLISEAGGSGVHPEVELFAYGRMPLAYSARCFTARAHGLTKDSCGFICERYPEGMPANTQDGRPLFTLNGIQTQSGAAVNLLPVWQEARAAGVGALRVSPQQSGMRDLLFAMRAAIDAEAELRIQGSSGVPECNGYWYGKAGLESVTSG